MHAFSSKQDFVHFFQNTIGELKEEIQKQFNSSSSTDDLKIILNVNQMLVVMETVEVLLQ